MSLSGLTLHPRTQLYAEKFAANLPQGLIVEGPIGSGVATVAHALVEDSGSQAFVLLPKKKQGNELVISPEDGSIVIEDIRQLYEQTRTKQSEEQTYIIDTGVKSMTVAAQNAFLKLLEEPRAGVHFIIATHRPDQLLSTIVSRCQTLSLLPVTDEQTIDVINNLGIDDRTKRTRLAFVGRGRPALIKRLAADDELYDTRVKIMTDAKTLLGNDAYAKLKIIHTYRDNRADAVTLLDDMNYQLQTVVKSHPDLSASRRIAKTIDKQLEARERIGGGGNIRIQLASVVL